MPEHTTGTPGSTGSTGTAAGQPRRLIPTLCALLALFRSVCMQERVFVRMVALCFAKLATVGRQTLSQQILALGQGAGDWSAFYRLFNRERIDEERLFGLLLQQTLVHVPAQTPYVVGVDATHIPRTSRRMPLAGWMRAPGTAYFKRGIQPGQRFAHCAMLTPIEEGYSRALPLRFLPAPVPSAVSDPSQAQPEWQVGLQEVRWVRQQLDANGRSAQPLLVLADGAYDHVELWRQLPAACTLLVRTAKNRHLRRLPERGGRGRPRLYGAQAPHPQAWLHEAEGWQRTELVVRGRPLRLRYRVEGPFLRPKAPGQPLFLLVVAGARWTAGVEHKRRRERDAAFYLLNAHEQEGVWQLPYPVEQLLVWVWQRWELEVAHREMKSGLGVGEMQCWSKAAAALSVQWSVWLYALLLLAAYRCWGLQGGPPPPGKWQQARAHRWSLNTVWRTYRTDLWREADFAEVCLRSTANWPKIERWAETLLAGMLDDGVT